MNRVQLSARSVQPHHAEVERTDAFQLEGYPPTLSLEPDGWLTAAVPLTGAPADLLRQQVAIRGIAR